MAVALNECSAYTRDMTSHLLPRLPLSNFTRQRG